MQQVYDELKRRLAEVHDISHAAGLLGWDQRTKMPPRGAEVRAEQLATLQRLAHERFVDDQVGRLLDELRPWEESRPYESDEASLVRVARADYEKARRVPAELEADLSRAAALGLRTWAEARKASDFGHFLPSLRRNLDLKLRYIDCFEVTGEPYDILLDDYERGMKTSEVDAIFDRLKADLIPFIRSRSDGIDDSFLHGRFEIERQQRVIFEILRRFGYKDESWRLDETLHPFASGLSTQDIRITTHYHEDSLDALFSCMHECGHGLYEHGVSPTLERTPLARGVSMALHESQSRMWENVVGRGRAFWSHFYPQLQAAFPEVLGSVELDSFYRAVNKVQPSLIRIEADEVTYNLHIILRFELERELIAGSLALEDLPEAWNARMQEYLGVDVPHDADGVLQDVHWSGGSMGYFPTYSLGNVVSVQVWERVKRDLPDLDQQIAAGEFEGLRTWLGEHLYRHGRKFTPRETLERVVGGPIDPEPYLGYLKAKLGDL